MRQIKFKGKSIDTKKWVYGSLVKTPFGTFIEWYEDSICNKVEVDPSTVCQYTGLKDKDGNEVWEGDNLKACDKSAGDGMVVFRYGAFSLLAKDGKSYCIALTYLSEGNTLSRYKVLHSKFDKEGSL